MTCKVRLALNHIAKMGRVIIIQCRNINAAGKVSGNNLCPERAPVGNIIVPMQMQSIPNEYCHFRTTALLKWS